MDRNGGGARRNQPLLQLLLEFCISPSVLSSSVTQTTMKRKCTSNDIHHPTLVNRSNHNNCCNKLHRRMYHKNNIMSFVISFQWLVVVLVVLLNVVVDAGIQTLDVILVPTDQYVVYMVSYINGPDGSIDLRKLNFEAISDSYASLYSDVTDDGLYVEDDDDTDNDDTPSSNSTTGNGTDVTKNGTSTAANTTSGGGNINHTKNGGHNRTGANGGRRLPQFQQRSLPNTTTITMMYSDNARRILPEQRDTKFIATTTTSFHSMISSNGSGHVIERNLAHNNNNGTHPDDNKDNSSTDANATTTFVDIVVFPLPNDCIQDPASPGTCDYAELGVGKRVGTGPTSGLRWCCSEESVYLGLCDKTKSGSDPEYGRLMIDTAKFQGHTMALEVPGSGPLPQNHLDATQALVGNLASNNYIVMYANCDGMNGRQIQVTGESIFLSNQGYLPGELYGYMYFFTAISFIYAVLFLWYGALMYLNRQYRIAIEQWIIITISLGLLEVLFRTGDYNRWNNTGYRSTFLIWAGIMLGVLKQGLSRCLLVIVAMGWGVVTDTINIITMIAIITLGVVYTIIAGIIDGMILFAVERLSTLSFDEETSIFDVVTFLGRIKVIIDLVFLIWIVVSLFRTVAYLKKENQTRKLVRTQTLLKIMAVSIFIAFIWGLVSLIDKVVHSNEVIQEEHAWAKDAAMEANYLFVLISIAILWKPNPNARQYAYVMELGDTDDDYDSTHNGRRNDLELTPSSSRDRYENNNSVHSNQSDDNELI